MTHQTKRILLAALLAGVHVQGSAQTTTAPKSAPHQAPAVSTPPSCVSPEWRRARAPCRTPIRAGSDLAGRDACRVGRDPRRQRWRTQWSQCDPCRRSEQRWLRRVSISAAAPGVACAEGNVAWSPDSKRIAFLSDAAKPGQLQLYVTDAAGGPARRLTGVNGFLATPGWSPDGRDNRAPVHRECHARCRAAGCGDAPDRRNHGRPSPSNGSRW